MAEAQRILNEVLPSYQFRVLIGIPGAGFDKFSFSRVSGLDVDHGIIKYRAGNEGKSYRKMSAIAEYGPVVCQRGFTTDIDGFAAQALNFEPLSGSLGFSALIFRLASCDIQVLGGSTGQEVQREYSLQQPIAKGWKLGELNANSSALLIEAVTIEHEGIVSKVFK